MYYPQLTVSLLVCSAFCVVALRTEKQDTADSPVASTRNYYLNIGGTYWPNSSVFNTTKELGPNVYNNDHTLILSTWFGAYPCIGHCGGPTQASWCNGGIPQMANLTIHVEAMKSDLAEYLPRIGLDPATFSGFVVNDYESWVPSYEHSSPEYQQASLNYTAWKYPEVAKRKNSGPLLEELSRKEFHAAGIEFLVTTIATLKAHLPKAQGFGFYGYPTVYGYYGYNQTAVELANDALMPLWNEVTAFYPSIYLPYKTNTGADIYKMSRAWVSRQIVEANRLAAKVGPAAGMPGAKKVVPYTWCRYHSGEPNGLELLDPTDAWLEFDFPFSEQFPTHGGNTSAKSYVEGVIIWGSESYAPNATMAVNWFKQNKKVFTAADPVNPHSTAMEMDVPSVEQSVEKKVGTVALSPDWTPQKWTRCGL